MRSFARPKLRRSGITILEIMIAMSLMTVVIVAFASVFPAGYKLNYANLQQNKAAGLANAIAEELRAVDVNVLQSSYVGQTVSAVKTRIRTLNDPNNGISIGTATNDGKFWIDNTVINNTGSGIAITVNQSAATPVVSTATIQVTIRWRESRRNGSILKKFTLVTMNTDILRR